MNVIDLFAGCGGLSLGFQKSGFNILRAYDNWDDAIKCYVENFDHEILKRDLSNSIKVIEEIKPLGVDIIVGGPPCQDFSHAGKRKEGLRADLTKSFAEIVFGIKPKWYVMENVDRAAKSASYSDAKSILKSAGYGVTEVVLDASKCGVPQKRKRFFSIGRLGEQDNFLVESIGTGLSSDSMTIREYFGDKFDFEHYYRHPRNYNRRAVFSIDEPAPTMRGVNRPVPSGYPGHHGDTHNAHDGIRALTTNERAMIQTFPEDFIWVGSKTKVEQMIGNAVPVGLAEFISRIILSYEEEIWKGQKLALAANS